MLAGSWRALTLPSTRWLAAFSGLAALVGVALLSAPLRDPVSLKFALGAVAAAPSEPERLPMPAIPPELRREAAFLAAGQDWETIVRGAAERFPPPSGEARRNAAPGLADLVAETRAGRGECSDFTEALMVLCAVGGRSCREWGNVAVPQPPASGHASVDLWLPETGRWAMLDLYLSVWVAGPDGEPLSTPEVREAIRGGGDRIRLVTLRAAPAPREALERYYGNPGVKRIQLLRNHPERVAVHWTRGLERRSVALGQLLQWLLGVSPQYLVPDSPEYAGLRSELAGFRRRAAAGTLCLILALGGGLAAALRAARLPSRAPPKSDEAPPDWPAKLP